MKNGLWLGLLTAAVAVLLYREFKPGKKKCGCAGKSTSTADAAAPSQPLADVNPSADPGVPAATPVSSAADAVTALGMDGWGKRVAL